MSGRVVNILLVEDEPTLRTGTEQFLVQRGFTVIAVASGEGGAGAIC